MISDFYPLSQKIQQLINAMQILRQENVALQTEITRLKEENAYLIEKRQQAYEAVQTLLEKLPAFTEFTTSPEPKKENI